jgi:hypothetical protein
MTLSALKCPQKTLGWGEFGESRGAREVEVVRNIIRVLLSYLF